MHTLIDFFQNLYHFDKLIHWGGHLVLIAIVFAETGVMAGFFLPGDSLLVTAGILASAGHLNVWPLVVELSIAAIVGDTLNYYVGKQLGARLFTREDSWFFKKSYVLKTHAFYEKYGSKTIVLARFVPIIRTFAPAVAGVGQMNYSKFILFNVLGGILWVCSMVLGAYFLGKSIPNIDKHLHKIILAVIFLSFIPIAIEYLKSRRRADA